ncbi:MAG TPA: L-glutamate gamma-semialdehyde dehydrogenase, partial [Planctomycetaceae bacterium]|nr:L-glutamate gamma-semialdehyde dehydrogenase [Planctomycetaceae bacterium]
MPRKKAIDPAAVEAETQALGRQLWAQLARRRPSIFERRWWDDRLLYWAMSDESVKVQMFRFVDVLPMLRTHEAVTRHLHEYFEEVRKRMPGAARLILEHSQPNTVLGRALALNARSNARRMAERFIAGSSVDEVFQAVLRLRRHGFAFTLDVLGEAVLSDHEAEAYQQTYLDLITGLAPRLNDCVEIVQVDRDHAGPIPRVNVSLKLSALDSQFRPVDAAGVVDRVKARLRPLLRAAREFGVHVHIDMEHYAYKDLTLAIFREILMEDEFRDLADVGLVIQTYLPDAETDLHDLLRWTKRRGTPIWIRLVKGAYWDYETVVARLRGWPVPVFRQKWQTDDNFERQTRFLMENYRWLRPALASHNLRSIAHGLAWAKKLRIPRAAYELQMLYGMGTEQARLFAEQGYRVRIYTPFGRLIPGMAYLVRRLLENTSNDSFLRHSVTEDIAMEDLMMKPADVGARSPAVPEEPPTGFRNEPHTDFSRAAARDAMREALEAVAGCLGREYPLTIDGRLVETRDVLVSRNPSHAAQVVG